MRKYGFDWAEFWGPFGTVLFVGIVALLVASIPGDQKGVQPWQHRGPVPEGVTQLSASSYIVKQSSGVQATDICTKTVSETGPVEEVRNIRELDADYVECDLDQVWNAKGPDSINYGASLVNTMTSPFFLTPFIIAMLIGLLGWTLPEYRRTRRANQSFALTQKDKLDLLTTEWAAGRITDLEFDKKHTEILQLNS